MVAPCAAGLTGVTSPALLRELVRNIQPIPPSETGNRSGRKRRTGLVNVHLAPLLENSALPSQPPTVYDGEWDCRWPWAGTR